MLGFGLGIVTPLLFVRDAVAHGFGQRYDLPVPLLLWIVGAGATILLSFVLVAMFARGSQSASDYPRVNLLRWRIARTLSRPILLFVFRIIGVIVFGVTLVAGFFGDPDPYKNLIPVLVWVIWWVGIVYVCALVADVWTLVNPFRTLFFCAEWCVRRWLRCELSLYKPYPKAMEVWPAVVGLLIFFWAELLWPGGSIPLNLAIAISLYSCVTWIGMFIYGREIWLQNADPFSLVFSVFARFAPLEIRVRPGSREKCPGYLCRYLSGDCINGYVCLAQSEPVQLEWNLRPFAVGLSNHRKVPVSMMVFVLILLASVTFDGILETPLWITILDRSLGHEIFIVGNLALVLFPMLFCLVYIFFCWIMLHCAMRVDKRSTNWDAKTSLEIGCVFVLTLVPIAIAYHLAHYLSFLFVTGQYVVPLISDPLGLGWNLFGTAEYQANIGVINAKVAWYIAVIAVVFGHVFSVYIAHLVARRTFRDSRAAFWSQIPMIALMVLYTMLSLWILAQPMVG